ncbi:mitochondrial genome maintenance exonuclease 1 [Aedes aegypti]|uniref:Mitochondrial genome maintenance exonuclease 1 n=1 Tax=Aedes aegypti TaxID=7159 RepID=A0A6I8U866_AEDAE|nr:mitochondrial genome maintenance exonuclease 1 [Aedes aegypti]XP_021707984.1 mitochondrial genome maintenance exonuclease 1 [Aedes aegypti]
MITFASIRTFATAIKKAVKKPKQLNQKARIIQNLNYENKALFGAVNKKETDELPRSNRQSANVFGKDSEMYWLVQRDKSIRKNDRSSSNDQQMIISKSSPEIPFNTQELRSVLTFPLVPSSNGTLERSWTRHDQYETDRYKSPSVNKILTATMSESSRQILLKWKASKIAELGEEGFTEFQKATLARGSNFHSCLESWLNQEDVDRDKLERARDLWASINGSLERIGRPARVIERKIYHPFLHYNGVVDCVSSLDNKLHIIEWKTSENQKASLSSTYDAPIQLCAYLGALKSDPEFSEMDIAGGAVFVAYTSGNPAHVHLLSPEKLRKYWSIWLRRLQEYWIRYRDNTLPEPI